MNPSVYPTGVTIFDPERTWNGYTLFQAPDVGAMLIDMNGREVKLWRGLQGFPNRLLPGGHVFGSSGRRTPRVGFRDQLDLLQVDWNGRVVWRFDRLEYIEDVDEAPRWMARQHHDFQREGSAVGYHAPGQEPQLDRGRTLLLVHENVRDTRISEHPLLDDKLIEVAWDGSIVWQWRAHEHFGELGFDAASKSVLRRDPNLRPDNNGVGDWLHINSASWLGPNRRYQQGDTRFHPDNVIWTSREANLIAIVDRRSGAVVWQLGPRYDGSAALLRLGWIIGPHDAHCIPEGLPGAGNLLIFDNGGWAGYGEPSPNAVDGRQTMVRDHSRVLELDPVTLEVVWEYSARSAAFGVPYRRDKPRHFGSLDDSRFYSPLFGNAQRLPNGNTLITEGTAGRVFEVTQDRQTVWEFVSPNWGDGRVTSNFVYRAYRAPYHWVPQRDVPRHTAIAPIDLRTFRVPGAAGPGRDQETAVEGVDPQLSDSMYFAALRGPART
jgi:hypothetical protein